MNKKKILLALLLAGFSVCAGAFGLAGCSKNNNGGSGSSGTEIDDPDTPLDDGSCKHGDLDKILHNAATAANCHSAGNKENWFCQVCNTYFEDANLTITTTLSEITIPVDSSNHEHKEAKEAHEATCQESGNLAYWICLDCGSYALDENFENVVDWSDIHLDMDDILEMSAHKVGELIPEKHEKCEEGLAAHYVCEDCGKLFNENEEVCTRADLVIAAQHNIQKNAYCDCRTDEGGYYECEDCGKTFSDADGIIEAEIDKDGHNLIHVLHKPATCTEAGTEEYWYCEGGKYFDIDGKTKLTPEQVAQLELAPLNHKNAEEVSAVDATCDTDGNIKYWYCPDCKKYFSDAECTIEITLAETVIHAAHKVTKVDAKNPGCDTDGNIEYWLCSECGDKFAEEECITKLDDVTIPAAHNATKVDAVAPTCEDKGREEYWHCEACGKNFKDEACEQPVEDLAELDIAATGHKYPEGYTYNYAEMQYEKECETHDHVDVVEAGKEAAYPYCVDTLARLQAAIEKGGYIKVECPIVITDGTVIEIDKDVTIDLGGYGITSNAQYVISIKANSGATVNIDNGTIASSIELSEGEKLSDYRVVKLQHSDDKETASTLNLKNVAVTANTADTFYGEYGVFVGNNNTVNMTEGSSVSGASYGVTVWKSATFSMNGGEISGCAVAVCGNGSAQYSGSTIELDSVKIYDISSTAVYAPQIDGVTTIKNCEITSTACTAVEVRAGSLVIENSILEGKGNFDLSKANGNGATTYGAALAIVKHTTDKSITVSVTDSTLTGTYAIIEKDWQGKGLGNSQIEITLSGNTYEGCVYSEHQLVEQVHSFGEWIEKSATCAEEGIKGHYHCEHCGRDFDAEGNEITDLVIEKTSEHVYTEENWVAETPATCEEAGIIGHFECACGAMFDAAGNEITDLVIEAKGHNYVWDEGTPATCDETGVMGHYVCADCGKLFVINSETGEYAEVEEADLVISATGHAYDAGYVYNYEKAVYESVCANDPTHAEEPIEAGSVEYPCKAYDEASLKVAVAHGGNIVLDEVVDEEGNQVAITLTAFIRIEKSVTIDLNGNTIKSNEKFVFWTKDNATVVIKNGTVECTNAAGTILYANESNVTFDGVDLVGNREGVYGLRVLKGATVKLTDSNMSGMRYAVTLFEGSTLTMDGCTITDSDCGVFGDGTVGWDANGNVIAPAKTTVTLNNTTIETKNAAVYNPQYGGETTITSCTLTSANECAIEVRAGSVTIEGSRLTSSTETFVAPKNKNGSSIGGAAIGISQHSTNDTINVSVSSSTLTGVYAIYEDDVVDNKAHDKINIELGENNTFYGYVYSHNCPDVNTVTFVATADELKAAVANGGTIQLTADIENVDLVIASGVNVTLDLNGHKISNDKSHTIVNNGILNLKNGSVYNGTHKKAALLNYGEATVEGVTLTRAFETSSTNSWYVIDNNKGTLTLINATVDNDGDDYSSLVRNLEGTMVISGDQGSYTSGKIAIKNDDNGILTIYGGTFDGANQSLQNWGYVEIYGGTFIGTLTTGTWSKDQLKGETKINGGTIEGKLCLMCNNPENTIDYAPVVTVNNGVEVEGVYIQVGTEYALVQSELSGYTVYTVEKKQVGATVSGIRGAEGKTYKTLKEAYDDVREMMTEAGLGFRSQTTTEEKFNEFFSDGGNITWTIYGEQHAVSTDYDYINEENGDNNAGYLFSFGRRYTEYGNGLGIKSINIVGGNASAKLIMDSKYTVKNNGVTKVMSGVRMPENNAGGVSVLNVSNITIEEGEADIISFVPSWKEFSAKFSNCVFIGNVYYAYGYKIDLTIENSQFLNNGKNDGSQGGYGFAYAAGTIASSDGTICNADSTITLKGCTFDGYKRGINLRHDEADITVEGCTFRNILGEDSTGKTHYHKAAIQMFKAKSFTIVGNTFEESVQGCAIQFYTDQGGFDADKVIINDNTINSLYYINGYLAWNGTVESSGNVGASQNSYQCIEDDDDAVANKTVTESGIILG